jgi:hypothetical protein
LTEAFARGGEAVEQAFAKMEGKGRAHSAVQIEEAGKIKAKFVEISADIQGIFEKLSVTIGLPLVGALETFEKDLKKVIGDITLINDLINKGEFKKALDIALFGQQKGPSKFDNSSQTGGLLPKAATGPGTTNIPPTNGGSSSTSDAERAESDRIKRLIDFNIEQQHRAADVAEKLAKDQLALDQELYDSKMALAQITLSAFESIVIGGEKAEDVIKNLAQSLLQAATQAALFGQGPFASLFGTSSSGGVFGSLFGRPQPRASGGPVSAGRPYIVGEKRPELFVPSQSGSIVPRIGSGAAKMSVNVHNYGNDNVDVQQRNGPYGPSLDVIIGQKINSHLGSGRANSVMKGQFGLGPQKVRR